MSEPIPFAGTPEEVRENYATHLWVQEDEDGYVCGDCSSKPWHAAAHYKCGVEPPRSQHPSLTGQSVRRFAAYFEMMKGNRAN
jgi:hypothetical protein